MRACRHEHLRRSKRRSWEKLAGLIRLRPYRCQLCHQRLWRYAGRVWLELPLLAAALGLGLVLWRPGESVRPPVSPQRIDVVATMPPDPGATPGRLAAVGVDSRPVTPAPTPTVPESHESGPTARPSPTARSVPTVAPTPSMLRLLQARAVEQGGGFLLELRHSAGTLEPRLSRLSGPPRLILDLPGRWHDAGASRAPEQIGGEIVSRVRFGRHQDKLRIVLDLASTRGIRQRAVAESGRVELRLVKAANAPLSKAR